MAIKLYKKVADISYANTVDFTALKNAGYTGVIIRTGYSTTTDTKFKTHTENAISHNMDIGFYTYIMSTTIDSAIDECDYALSLIRPYRNNVKLPVYADLEDERVTQKIDGKQGTKIVNVFFDYVKNHGFVAGLYTNPSMLSYYYDTSKLQHEYLWLAHWTGDAHKPPNTLQTYKPTAWQWGTTKIAGQNIDSNLFDELLNMKTLSLMSERRRKYDS